MKYLEQITHTFIKALTAFSMHVELKGGFYIAILKRIYIFQKLIFVWPMTPNFVCHL